MLYISEKSSVGKEHPDDTFTLEIDSPITASQPYSQPKPKSGRRKFSRLCWEHVHDRDEAPTIPIYDVCNNSENSERGISLPINQFRRFFTDNLLGKIAEQSSLHAVQQNPNRPLDLDRSELLQWLGLSMYISISKIPNTRLHWSSFSVGNEKVSSTLSRDRWEEIKMKLHLADDTRIDPHDKLSKVRPLLDHLRSKFKEIPMTIAKCRSADGTFQGVFIYEAIYS